MGYTELVKNFQQIRDYLREFYVYGFKSREGYGQKSGRSYDNERRRIESYLGDYTASRRTAEGKIIFLSIDSRTGPGNPLYRALKTKSFTSGDITLHFILLDILHDPGISLPLREITRRIDEEYLSRFPAPMLLDESTVRKKLKEYGELGLIKAEKRGRGLVYRRESGPDPEPWKQALAFFSETAPAGVIGSFLLDELAHVPDIFRFKHHYITQALDSEVLCTLLEAMGEKRAVIIHSGPGKTGKEKRSRVVPLKIFCSVQTGRQYLLGYRTDSGSITPYRLYYIVRVEKEEPCPQFNRLREKLERLRGHMWGVRCHQQENRLERVEFTVRVGPGEDHILQRLEREKRCGRVERLDERTCRFSAEVYDTGEMIPWIRTFIGRIVRLRFSNRTWENQFREDLEALYRLYGLEEGET